MKVFIDKHGGYHYHKEDCPLIQPSLIYMQTGKPPKRKLTQLVFPYEPIQHRIRKYGLLKIYGAIVVDGIRYAACPFCFGEKR